jgi:hypothetical protein
MKLQNQAFIPSAVHARASRARQALVNGEKGMPTSTELRENADAKFKKKELQRLDGGAAMAEYEAASRATMEKTARLRALRLSSDTSASPAPKQPKRPTKTSATKIR